VQVLQLVWPVCSWNVPEAQSLQVAAPAASWNLPAAQPVQPCVPAVLLAVPAAQATHVPGLPPPQPVCSCAAGQW
jgi:hypothetical protein